MKTNQITLMFQESNNRMKAIMAEDFDKNAAKIAASQKEFTEQIKLVQAVITAVAVACKNERAFDALKDSAHSLTTVIE